MPQHVLAVAGSEMEPAHQIDQLLVQTEHACFLTCLVTGLADERTRGGLDILLCTPVSSAAVIRAKWWSAFKVVLWIALFPALIESNYVLRWLDPVANYRNQLDPDWMIPGFALILHPICCGAMFAKNCPSRSWGGVSEA